MIAVLLLATDTPGRNCTDPQAQQEMNRCAAQDCRQADDALNALCDHERYLVRGGSVEPPLVATCRAGLTRARTKQLKDLIEQ